MAPTLIRFSSDYATTGEAGPPIGFPHGGGLTWPRTVGGVTVTGPASGLPVNVTAGWVSGDDPLVRGRWRVTNSGAPMVITIDLVALGGAGVYRVGLGACAQTYQQTRWRVRDGVGGTALIDRSWTGADAGAWGNLAPSDLDQFCTLNTAGDGIVNGGVIDADITTPGLQVATVTFAGTVCEIELGGHASGSFSSDLSFITLEKVVSPPNPRAGFRFASGYPTEIVAGAVITPPIVLQAVDASGADTTDGVGTTVTLAGLPMPDGVFLLSGTTGVQAAPGTTTFAAVRAAPGVSARMRFGLVGRGLLSPLLGAYRPVVPIRKLLDWYYDTLKRLEFL